MFCPHCGQQNDDQSRFCNRCGGKLPSASLSNPVAAPAVAVSSDTAAPAVPAADASGNPYAISAGVAQTRAGNLPGEAEPHGGYAGFWERFAAHFLDNFLVSIVVYGLIFVILLVIGVGVSADAGNFSEDSLGIAGLLAIVAVAIVIPWLYFALMESGEGRATLGKRALGLVVQRQDGERIGFGRATGRHFSKMLSSIMMIGYLMQPFTARKQALHDLITDVVVVRQRKDGGNKALVWVMIGIGVFFVLIAVIGILAAIAIPAFVEYQQKAALKGAMSELRNASVAVTSYYESHEEVPASLADAGYAPLKAEGYTLELDPDTGILTATFTKSSLIGSKLEYVPSLDDDGNVQWQCEGSEIPEAKLPAGCVDVAVAEARRAADEEARSQAESDAAAEEEPYMEQAPEASEAAAAQ